MNTARTPLAAAVLFALVSATAAAQGSRPGIVGRTAPSWDVESWHGLADGLSSLDVTDFRGKVVYLFFFQSWCPGCHSHGFPTLKRVRAAQGDTEDVVFVAIQTVFEGHSSNTARKGIKDLANFDLDIPFGHAPGKGRHSSPGIMESYRSGGTPWTVIIDKKGIVRFDGFRIDAERALSLVAQLRGES